MGETGELITQLLGELKGFDATAENQKGFLGFFKKKSNELEALKVKYDKADVNEERIKAHLEDLSLIHISSSLAAGWRCGMSSTPAPSAGHRMLPSKMWNRMIWQPW